MVAGVKPVVAKRLIRAVGVLLTSTLMVAVFGPGLCGEEANAGAQKRLSGVLLQADLQGKDLSGYQIVNAVIAYDYSREPLSFVAEGARFEKVYIDPTIMLGCVSLAGSTFDRVYCQPTHENVSGLDFCGSEVRLCNLDFRCSTQDFNFSGCKFQTTVLRGARPEAGWDLRDSRFHRCIIHLGHRAFPNSYDLSGARFDNCEIMLSLVPDSVLKGTEFARCMVTCGDNIESLRQARMYDTYSKLGKPTTKGATIKGIYKTAPTPRKDLRERNLDLACFEDCDLSQYDLSWSVLRSCEFFGGCLDHAKFRSAFLLGVTFNPERSHVCRITRDMKDYLPARKRISMVRADFVGSYIYGLYLYCVNAPYSDFSENILSASFQECNLDGAKFSKSVARVSMDAPVWTYSGSVTGSNNRPQEARMTEADLSESNLDWEMKGITVSGTKFDGSIIRNLDVKNSIARGNSFSDCLIASFRASDSNFHKSIFRSSLVAQFSAEHSNFVEADFSNSVFRGSFARCDLSNATFRNAIFHHAGFRNCKARAIICRDTVGRVSFESCDLAGANFANGILSTASFRNCDLQQAQFADVDRAIISFKGCDLSKANFENVRFQSFRCFDCKLDGAIFRNAKRTPLPNAHHRSARLYGYCLFKNSNIAAAADMRDSDLFPPQGVDLPDREIEALRKRAANGDPMMEGCKLP